MSSERASRLPNYRTRTLGVHDALCGKRASERAAELINRLMGKQRKKGRRGREAEAVEARRDATYGRNDAIDTRKGCFRATVCNLASLTPMRCPFLAAHQICPTSDQIGDGVVNSCGNLSSLFEGARNVSVRPSLPPGMMVIFNEATRC